MAQEDDDMVTEAPPVPSLSVQVDGDDESVNMECERTVETEISGESVGEVNGIKPRT